MKSSLPSTRTLLRAIDRYGPAVLDGRVSKYGPRIKANGQFTHGTRTPKPLSRRAAKARRIKLARRGEQLDSGIQKIRDLWLRAGVLVLPFSEKEIKMKLQEAKKQFEDDGVIAADLGIQLQQSGYDLDQLEQYWTLMSKAEINPDGIDTDDLETDEPLNSFH
jgi:hypothetical protein